MVDAHEKRRFDNGWKVGCKAQRDHMVALIREAVAEGGEPGDGSFIMGAFTMKRAILVALKVKTDG